MPKELTTEQRLKLLGIEFHDERNGEWLFVKCVFHNDAHDNIKDCKGRVHPQSGVYKCLSCGHTTSFNGFAASAKGTNPTAIALTLKELAGDNEVTEKVLIDVYHNQLLQRHDYLKLLAQNHGLSIESVLKYKLGFDPDTNRITIPIYRDDRLVNIRKYSYQDRNRKIISTKGHGGIQLFLSENCARSTDIYIAEGEFKAIILNQQGFNACAPTNGAKNWDAHFNEWFKDKDVVVIYDLDEAGRNGAAMLCQTLHPYAKSVRNVLLDLDGTPNQKDINDYFVKAGKTADDLRKLVLSVEPWSPPKPIEKVKDERIYSVRLCDSSNAEYFDKKVRFTAVVSAKDTNPFITPAKLAVNCQADQSYCAHCFVSSKRGHQFSIDPEDTRILELLNKDDEACKPILRAISGVYPRCKASSFNVLESRNVEELRLIPEINVAHNTGETAARKVYSVSHGIETNATYEFESVVCVEGDRHATLLCYKNTKATDDISNFKLKEDLTVFQPKEWTKQSIHQKLQHIYSDLSANVTRIYSRNDLHLFYDLAYHSVLYIRFQGENYRGWVDALCIGDSGQGKSEASTRLIQHYRTGERVDTKNCSIAGLVGGLQEMQKRWFISWGSIPINDRRLVFLEEIKGMPVEHLGKLTDMRSTGKAQIRKIEGGITNARTRLVWISNPRTDRKLCTYNYGVDAIKELIGSLEDIRRFDMCIAVGSGDVDNSVINMGVEQRPSVAHIFTSPLCSHLVMWAWSRTESQVIFEHDAEKEALQAATRLSETYSSSCPIVEPSDQRLKVARLSAALAARLFSTDDGETLIVRKCHVEYIEHFLNLIYSSKTLGYLDYSKAQLSETRIVDKEQVTVKIKEMPNARDSVDTLIQSDVLDTQVLMDITEWNKDTAGEFIGYLVRKLCVRKLRRAGYRKTPAFTQLLKELQQDGNLLNKTLRDISAAKAAM